MTHATDRRPRPTAVVDELISRPAPRPRLPALAQLVEASGGCAKPVRLTGASYILDRDGAVLLERAGDVFAPCGNRRAAVCPACSDRYAADAFHLLRAGLAGDDTKNVPATVVEHPRVFLTLTAPVVRAGAHPHDHPPRARHPLPLRGPPPRRRPAPRHRRSTPTPTTTTGAVLWQAHAGAALAPLHHRPAPRPRRRARRPRPPTSASTPGCPTPRSPSTNAAAWSTSTPSSASTDPTDPPTPARPGSTGTRSRRGDPARRPHRHRSPPAGPTGPRSCCGWGAQLDLRPVTADRRGPARGRRTGRSATPRWPATSPSTPPRPPAPPKDPTGPSATATTSPTSTSPSTTGA